MPNKVVSIWWPKHIPVGILNQGHPTTVFLLIHWKHFLWCYKVCICSVILGELESYRNWKGFSFFYPEKFTGCPKSSFLSFISLYFSTIGLGKQIVPTKVVSFNIMHYFRTCCATFWLEYLICVLPSRRCACANIFSSHIFFVFHSPNCSNFFLVFCEYYKR